MILDIKRAAKEHGKTLKDVAADMKVTRKDKNGEEEQQIGVSLATLSQHASGNPTVKVLQAIADAIGCRITELFYEESTNVPTEEETPPGRKETGDSGDQSESDVTIPCPHCGKPLNICVHSALSAWGH